MRELIIDTNAAVVANRQNASVSIGCIEACIRFIVAARETGTVLLDQADEIRAEYAKALIVSPPHGLGALFLFHILQHQFDPKRVRRIPLGRRSDGELSDFPEAPNLAGFDRDDRKFAALAAVTGVAVSTAIDSDWVNFQQPLAMHGIKIEFICGSDQADWFTEK